MDEIAAWECVSIHINGLDEGEKGEKGEKQFV